MKHIFGKIGEGLLIILLIPLSALLLVVILPVILWFSMLGGLAKLFTRLRRDPRHTLPECYFVYKDSYYPTGEKELVKYFNSYIDIIKESTGATRGDTKIDRANNKDEDDSSLCILTISTTLETGSGTARLEMQAFGGDGDDQEFYACQDGDLSPYLVITHSKDGRHHIVFDVGSAETIEFLIGILRHGRRLSKAGQVWTKVADDVHIVNYSIKKSDEIGRDYGYRKRFSEAQARRYFFDK